MITNSNPSSTYKFRLPIPAGLPSWLDSGATHDFSELLTPDRCRHRLRCLSVLLPNNDTITYTHQFSATLGSFEYPANDYSDDDLHHSLEAVATFTNDMHGSVLFAEHGAIVYGSFNRPINFSQKLPADPTQTLNKQSFNEQSTRPPLFSSFPQ